MPATKMIRAAMARIATRAQVVTVLANAILNLLSPSDLSLVGITGVSFDGLRFCAMGRFRFSFSARRTTTAPIGALLEDFRTKDKHSFEPRQSLSLLRNPFSPVSKKA